MRILLTFSSHSALRGRSEVLARHLATSTPPSPLPTSPPDLSSSVCVWRQRVRVTPPPARRQRFLSPQSVSQSCLQLVITEVKSTDIRPDWTGLGARKSENNNNNNTLSQHRAGGRLVIRGHSTTLVAAIKSEFLRSPQTLLGGLTPSSLE